MNRLIPLSLILCVGCATTPPTAEFKFENGSWFNGSTFEERTAYIVDKTLIFSESDRQTAKSVDLEGAFVVPPFCEGHNHNLGGNAESVKPVVHRYLTDGVFYAVMPGSFRFYRDIIEKDLNTPSSLDVAFGNNGLTGSGGHPRGLRESLKDRFGLYPEFSKENLEDVGYFEADTLEEMSRKFNLIQSENPDFIKVMLYFAEEYDSRKDDPSYFGRRGFNPKFMTRLVDLAHEHNQRVAVHVESDFDMKTALEAGADIIMHMPSYDSSVRISDENIQLALRNNVAIVTTLSLANRYKSRDPSAYDAMIEAQRANLERMEKAGVKLVIGSDNVRDTSRGEADHLVALGSVTNLTLLNMWTKNCAQMAFPDRKIGRLESGSEASFLALAGNPLDDFEFTRKILWKVKDGRVLELEPKGELPEE